MRSCSGNTVDWAGPEQKVSPTCLAAGVRRELDEQRFIRTIEYAIDRGCNFIDCANNYGHG